MKKNIISILAICSVPITLSGCSFSSSNTVDEVISEETLKSMLLQKLNDSNLGVDEVSLSSYDTIEFTEEDKTQIKEKISGKASFKKYLCKFETTSLDRGINGSYAIIVSKINGEWICVLSYPVDEENWIYAAKGEVPLKKIREDLQTLKFPSIENCVVGKDIDTSIEIKDRQSNIELGNDSLKACITYDATFAKYLINVRMQYEFNAGKWELKNYIIDDPEYWVIEFNEGSQPAKPKDSFIINKLSDSSNYKNYMMNLNYVDNYYIAESSQSIHGNELNYNYVLIVTYDEFGDFEYNVTKKYLWDNSAWQEGEMEVSLKSANLEKFMGTWASTNGNFIRFTSHEGNKMYGTYTHKYADSQYVVYDISAELDITMEDNNWDLIITQGDVVSGEEQEHIVILPFSVDFSKSIISSNGNIYVAKADEDVGPGFIINEDGTTYTENDPLELEQPDENGFDSGLQFFDNDEESNEESEPSDDSNAENDDISNENVSESSEAE